MIEIEHRIPAGIITDNLPHCARERNKECGMLVLDIKQERIAVMALLDVEQVDLHLSVGNLR